MSSARRGLTAGVARREITPPAGVDLSGFGSREGAALGVRDPLHAYALTVGDGELTVALLALDLIGLTPAWLADTRRQVEARTGVPAAHQLYACTHTHGGPETGVLPSMGAADPRYLERLRSSIQAAVREALDNQQQASLVLGLGAAHRGANRRSAAFNPDGPHDGELDEIDPVVVTAQFRRPDGSPLATLVNYACHPTSSRERVVSADYPGHLRAVVESATGAPCLYVNGAGGDVNLRFDQPRQRGFAAARLHGEALAAEALRAAEGGRALGSAPVRAATAPAVLIYAKRISRAQALELRAEGVADLARARTLSQRRRARAYMIAYAQRVLDTYDESDWTDQVQVDVQALRIGDLALVALPVEFFAADGRALRASTPIPYLMIAGWSNGNLGYVPTRRAFARGGYEAETAFRWYAQTAPWHPIGGDNLRLAALDATARLFA